MYSEGKCPFYKSELASIAEAENGAVLFAMVTT